jgi:radical SAM protein with 4Fe4S-binding SPASM domain
VTQRRYFAVPVSWVPRDTKVIAISRVRPRWALLNQSAAAILRYCEGPDGRFLGEIHRSFETDFGSVPLPEFTQWLDRLENSGLVSGTAEAALSSEPRSDFESYRVEHAYIELLARCNLRCVHCFMGGAPEREEQLEPEEISALLGDFAACGGRYVTLSGGEPLIYKEFDTVAREIAAHGLYGTVITNGLSLRQRQLRIIDDLAFNLAISLDGITSEVNERIRGRGSAPVIASIERALNQLGPDRVILSFTPVKANLGEIDNLFSFVEAQGIRRVNLSIYEEVGRAAQFASSLSLDADDRSHLMSRVYHHAVRLAGQVEVDFNDTRNILSQFSADRSTAELHPLWRGVRVTSAGDVFPSSFGAVERFHLGNIRSASFRSILSSDVLRQLYLALLDRDGRTPKCRDCTWRQICRGGSVASAYCASGEIYAPDAYCEAYLDVFPGVAAALANLDREPAA